MKARGIVTGLLVGAVLISVAVAQGADAKARRHTRTVKGTYDTPAVGLAGQGGGNCTQKDGIGCVEFATSKADHTITVSIADQSGQAVYASVSQDETSGGSVHQTVPVGDICGKTSKPLQITGGYPVDIFLWEGPGPDPPCAGAATQGTERATFSS